MFPFALLRLALLPVLLAAAPAMPPPAASTAPYDSIRPRPISNGSIVGFVHRAGTPLPYASVVVLEQRLGAMTDERGWFRISAVPPGVRRVKVQSIGCTPRTIDLAVQGGRAETLLVEVECFHGGGPPQAVPPRPEFTPSAAARARIGARCRVHTAYALVLDTVPKRIGLTIVPRAYPQAEARYFPNANVTADGGCDPADAGRAEVAFCVQCRRERGRWFAAAKRARH